MAIAHGELVQVVCSDLTDDQREFLISGAWDNEWDDRFAGDEEADFDGLPDEDPEDYLGDTEEDPEDDGE